MLFSREDILKVFCPTGEGGGIDPTCNEGGESSRGKGNKTFFKAAPVDVANAIKARGLKGGRWKIQGPGGEWRQPSVYFAKNMAGAHEYAQILRDHWPQGGFLAKQYITVEFTMPKGRRMIRDEDTKAHTEFKRLNPYRVEGNIPARNIKSIKLWEYRGEGGSRGYKPPRLVEVLKADDQFVDAGVAVLLPGDEELENILAEVKKNPWRLAA